VWRALCTRRAASSWLYVVPWGIRRTLRWVKERYRDPPIYITENGFSDASGTLDDQVRVDFFRRYINEVLKGCALSRFRDVVKPLSIFFHFVSDSVSAWLIFFCISDLGRVGHRDNSSRFVFMRCGYFRPRNELSVGVPVVPTS